MLIKIIIVVAIKSKNLVFGRQKIYCFFCQLQHFHFPFGPFLIPFYPKTLFLALLENILCVHLYGQSAKVEGANPQIVSW